MHCSSVVVNSLSVASDLLESPKGDRHDSEAWLPFRSKEERAAPKGPADLRFVRDLQ
jgi:hypothetical protein